MSAHSRTSTHDDAAGSDGKKRKRAEADGDATQNVLDLFTSGCLMAAAVSYFSQGAQTVKTFGSIGVACKWFGRETALVLCAAMCACY